MFDLILTGAEIVNADSRQHFDVCVSSGKITALVPPGTRVEAARKLDCKGLLMIPGLVDAHVHLREPGLVHKEGFESGTRAAAAGGVTTVMVMPTDKPTTITPEQFAEKRDLALGKAYVDFCLQAGVGPDLHHIRLLTDLGAISFEIFMADVPTEFLTRDAEGLLIALRAISDCGRVAGLTPGDHDVVVARTAAAKKRTPPQWKDVIDARPPVSEALGVAKGCIAARDTSASIHIRQVSCRMAVEVLRAFKGQIDLSAEVTPHNLLLDESEMHRQGTVAKVAPPLRPKSDIQSVRQALRECVIDMVATDHAPHLPEEKRINDIWAAPGGFPGLQTFLPSMLRLVELEGASMSDLVRWCCFEPAKRFGLHSRKGCIRIGADADLVLIDPRRRFRVSNEEQHSKAALSPFEGFECQGLPVKVFLRGTEVMSDGKVTDQKRGTFVHP